MVRQEVNPNQQSIRASNFGGLNTITSPVNIQIQDASKLLNIDTDISGSLTKRRGTFCLDSTSSSNPHFHYDVNTNTGIHLLFQIREKQVNVRWVDNDTVSSIQEFTNVFKDTQKQPYFVPIPGEVPRLLILNERESPIQFQFHEFTALTTAASSYDFTLNNVTDLISDSTAASNTHVFINDEYDSTASVTYSSGTVTVTPTTSFSEGDRLVILYMTWQWWAEAEIWRGDNFYKQVPRFNATDADRLVTVPESIYSDLDVDTPPYGITAYYSNNGTSFAATQNDLTDLSYTYNSNQIATEEDEYVFSNGTLNSNSTDSAVFPSPFAIVFGEISSSNKRSYNPISGVFSAGNLLFIDNHEFETGDLVKFTLPDSAGAVNEVDEYDFSDGYYVVRTSNNFILLYTDPDTPSGPLSINDVASSVVSSVNTTNGQFTTSSAHGFTTGDTVRFNSNVNDLPAGINSTTTYYVNVISTTVFSIHFERRILTQLIPTDAGTNVVVYSYLDNTFEIEKKTYDDIFFVRSRKFSFNRGNGITYNDGTRVIVKHSLNGNWDDSGIEAPLFRLGSTNDYHGFSVSTTSDLTDYVSAFSVHTHYSFIGGDDSDQTEDTLCRVVSVDTKWSGSSAQYEVFQITDRTTHLGGAYPVYGFGFYADYSQGLFPTVGTLHQERLFLGGFITNPNLVVASAISDLKVKDEYYNYFQITDDLDNLDLDPFDFTLNGDTNALINGFITWQQLLFVFTEDYVYRSLNVSNILSPSNRTFVLISNTGLISKYGTAISDTQIFFLGKDGLYDLPIVFENEYRTSEVSLKIRPLFSNITDMFSFVNYDKRRKKLYVGINSTSGYNTILYVYNLLNQSWTEYFSNQGFNIWYGASYNDKTLGEFFLISSNSTNYKGYLKFDHDKYIDYCTVFQPGVTATTDLIVYSETLSTGQLVVTADTLKWSPFSDINDVTVMGDDGVGGYNTLSIITDFIKVGSNTIELTDTGALAIDSTIYIIPDYSNTWYGSSIYVDDIAVNIDKVTTDFGAIDLDSLTDYSFDTHDYQLSFPYTDSLFPTLESGSTEATTVVGIVYPCYYRSGSINLEVLFLTKQISEVVYWFSNDDTKLDISTLGSLGQSNVNRIHSLQYISDVDLGVFHDTFNDGTVYTQLHNDSANITNQLTEFNLFSIPTPQNSQQANVVIWSANNKTFKCDAWQINLTSAQGSGYVSGVG